METKKMLPVMALLFALMIVPAALAQETSDQVTTADESDMEAFDVPLGAQYRFLQLERAITRNVLVGTEVVDVLETNHPDEDFTELHIILEEVESLLGEVKAYDFSGKDFNVIARDYVAFRKSSVELTQEFRELVRGNLTSEDMSEIRERVANISESLSALNDQITNTRREMNEYRVRNMLQKMNATNEQLLERIRNGQATKSDVWNGMRTAFSTLPTQEKIRVVREVASEAVRRAAVRNDIIENVTERLLQLVQERREDRLERKAEVRAAVMQRVGDLLERRNRVLNATANSVSAERLQQISSQFEWRNQELRR